jgi:hypothetical protein
MRETRHFVRCDHGLHLAARGCIEVPAVKKKSRWSLAFVIPLACSGCAAVTGDDPEQESEPQGATQEELRSAVSCTEKAATGYKGGAPYAMSVITVGGKSTAKPTAHAFLKMQQAADTAGVTLSINSGFRTQAEQQYLYKCYQTGSCNSGNLAARPGYSNHQNGRALDLATSNWTWVANNAARFGFKRTVPSERWHYEFFGNDPGGPCSAGAGTGTPPATPTPVGTPDAPADPATPDDPAPTPVPTPPPRPADIGRAAGGGCWSPTMNDTMAPGACVQSSADDVFYQCHDGLWYRGVAGGKGPYGTCTSTHAL